MKKRTDILPLTQTDKLCLVALAGLLITATLIYELTDGAALRAANEDNPQNEVVAVASPIDCTPLVEAVETSREPAQNDP